MEKTRSTLLPNSLNTITNYPRNKTIDQIFAEQVAKTPHQVALKWKNQEITYQQLDERSTQLSVYLEKLGIGRETLIALYLSRSPQVIVAILAILKAGATYVPLEISAPISRIEQILTDGQIKFIVSQQSEHENLTTVSDSCQIIELDKIDEKLPDQPLDVSEVRKEKQRHKAENLAYVMYTSGSTGKPKGVCISHRGVIRLVKNTNYVTLDSSQVILQAAPIAFDASTFEIWGALLNGGTLVIMPMNVPSLAELAQAINQYQITTLWLTAGLFHLMVTERIDALKPLKQLLAGGDVLAVADVQKVLNYLPGCTLINGYGPTENTTFTCCYTVPKTANLGKSIPIGKPIANTQVYILDSELNPVGVGVEGELYIGGDGLARGYLNRPDLTAKAFIDNPWSKNSQDKLYKTGDRVCWCADGAIEFLGRVDYQLKIRGFRVELEEIEATLRKCPQIKNAVVVAKEIGESKRLVAYLVTQNNQEIELDSIREFLQQQLPNYMLPSAYVFLEQLPLNINGKVDRQSLPQPELSHEENLIKPRNNIEEKLVTIWQEILRFRVGINQSFTQIGGNSLQAIQIISRIRDTFAVELPVTVMLEGSLTNNQENNGNYNSRVFAEAASTTIASLAQLIESQLKQQSLKQIVPLQPLAFAQELPLTLYQKRIWLRSRLSQADVIYNLPLAFKLEGNLDISLLEQACNQVIQRHQSLRTIFPLVDGFPVQRILTDAHFTISITEVNPQEYSPAQIQQLVNQEASLNFDLEQDILIRAKLIKLQPDEHIFILILHHIISDGWSLGILQKEISGAYQNLLEDKNFRLPKLEINYGDVTLWWQQQQQISAHEQTSLQYWQNQLQDAPPLLKLQNAQPSFGEQTFKGNVQNFHFSSDLTEKIKAFSQSTSTTLFMVLVATFLLLMHRYSNQDDIVISSPIANRHHRQLEDIIGCFVDIIPLRSTIEDDPSFADFLQQIRKVAIEAYNYANFPVEKLLSQLQDYRDLSYSPWLQVAFIFLNVPDAKLQLPELNITKLPVDKGCATFELTVLITQENDELQGAIEYNTDLYEHDTISRLIEHFQILLTQVTQDTNQPVKSYPLLTPKEQQLIVQQWNQTQTDYPRDCSIAQVFQTQVQSNPEKIALVSGGTSLTYEQLNHRSNQLAHYLRELGVVQETFVGLAIERSSEMIIAILAIVKAGGVYVPLDINYPQRRLQLMVNDSNVTIVLTQSKWQEIFSAHRAKVVCLDQYLDKIEQYTSDNLVNFSQPENLAYVNYTSGSTGTPKGVCIPHRAVVRLVKNTNYHLLSPQERFLQLAPISFDASTWEIWGSLLNGACLFIFPPEQPSLSQLGQFLEDYQITTLWLTAGLFHLMVDENLDSLRPLQQLFTGGDVLSVAHVRRFLDSIPHCRLVNGYGPTENTTFTCCYPLTPDAQFADSVPIGYPISNTQVYILDRYLHPVPIGIYGELYTGGDGLAKGYLNNQHLNQTKFIPNPFSEDDNSRLYKTGDLARYLADGTIEFGGRIDNQVKIRGFRIELGEIESALHQHPQIQKAVVMVREVASQQKQLLAYIVTHQQDLTVEQIRQFLEQRLPEYMIPTGFVFLDDFPLTPNGKVDRRSLLNLPTTNFNGQSRYVAPRDEWEIYLAKLWQKLLNLPQISIQDNFFTIGGDSLLAVSLFAQLSKKLATNLPIALIFQYPTIAKLAKILKKQGLSIPESSIIPLQTQGTKNPLFFINSLSYAEKIGRTINQNQPFYGLNIFGLSNFFRWQKSALNLETIASKFIKDLQTIQPQEPYSLIGYCADSYLVWEMAQQLLQQGKKVKLVVFIDAIWGLDKLPDDFYWQNLQRFGLSYIPYKIKQGFNFRYEQVRKQLKTSLSKYSLFINNQDLIYEAQNIQLFQNYYRAIANYQPQFYPGKINLLISEEMSFLDQNKLNSLAQQLEVQKLSGYHDTIFDHLEIVRQLEKLNCN